MRVSCEVYPSLTFNKTPQSNDLTFLSGYSENQEYLYTLIKELHDSGLSYRKITKYLNDREIPTHRGKKWGETGNSVHSVLKRKKQRDTRIRKLRNKEYKTRYSNFQIEYLAKISSAILRSLLNLGTLYCPPRRLFFDNHL